MRYCLMVAAPGVGLNWLRLPDSNRRPSAYEADEIPILYPAVKSAGLFHNSPAYASVHPCLRRKLLRAEEG